MNYTKALIALFILTYLMINTDFAKTNEIYEELPITNPGFEEGMSGWANADTGRWEYFAPVEGKNYAKSTSGSDFTYQMTGHIISEGEKIRMTVWGRGIFDDDYVECLLECPSDSYPLVDSSRALAQIGFFYDSAEIISRTVDVSPVAIHGDPETETSDDGANVWVDYDVGFRHAFSENHFYQPLTSDPIEDSWFLSDDNYAEGQCESGAKGPIILPSGKKFIYGSKSSNPFCEGTSETCKATLHFSPISGGGPDYLWGTEDDLHYVVWHEGDEDPLLFDAQLFFDKDEAKLWMILGGGYFLVSEIDTATGLILGFDDAIHYDEHADAFTQVADWSGDEWTGDNEWMEGGGIYKKGDFWYVFSSPGNLGANYTIRMGRGTSPTGPFYDKDGIGLNEFDFSEDEFGNSFLLGDDCFQLVPGHPHIWHEVYSDMEEKRILPLGNSITIGFLHTYRYRLHSLLTQAGYNFDFIGNLNDNPADYPGEWDMDHEGHGGWTAVDIDNHLHSWLEGYTSDIALIHLGTNDIAAVVDAGADIEDSEEAIVSILHKLRTDNPNITIYLAQILPFLSYHGGPHALYNDYVDYWNARLVEIGDSMATSESPIIIVDMNTDFGDSDLIDWVHPTENGARKMASKWADAILEGHENADTLYYLGYDYRTAKDGHDTEESEFDYLGIRRLYWADGWPTIWEPITITFDADDYPEAIGHELGIGFRNDGDFSSVAAFDRVEVEVSGGDMITSEETDSKPKPFEIIAKPNPFNGAVDIIMPENVGRVEIYDIMGNRITTLRAENSHAKWIPQNDIGSGVYFIRGIYDNKELINSVIYTK
ncbi:MAG: GDSL-type esterase/lipase family protein [Candidatus Zixiibacteriota bacterium]